MKNLEYNLDFYQALKAMFDEKKWIKGENFSSSFYMKTNHTGQTILVDTENLTEEKMAIYTGMKDQKYAIVEFITQLKNS